MSWIDNGPVSTPPRGVAYGAAALIGVAALAGLGLGFHSGWRESHPAYGPDQSQGADAAAVIAKPVVDVQAAEQQAPVNEAVASSNTAKAEAADTNDLDVKTAEAQAAQSKPSQSAPDIDQILTSSSEKPQAPAKPTTDEQAPPDRTDVPF